MRRNSVALQIGALGIDRYIPIMLIAGSMMQSYANRAVGALLIASLLLAIGLGFSKLMAKNCRSAIRAFLLTYAVCVFVGGLAQCYSLVFFNNPQSFSDALDSFFPYISAQPPFMTMDDMPYHNSPLAIVIWQQFYKLTWFAGLEFGPYIAVMLNALVMGIVANITVLTAQEIIGSDRFKLRLVGTLFAFNGLFILCGAILIRDCFTTMLNALVLWGIIRWLNRMTTSSLLLAVTILLISSYAILYLRAQSVSMFAAFGGLMLLVWLVSKQLNYWRWILLIILFTLVVTAQSMWLGFFQSSQETQAESLESYALQSSDQSSSSSLGMRFIVNQPLPIRIAMNGATFMINPIPLWAYFDTDFSDYQWLKGYNGLYQLLWIPMIIGGFIASYRRMKADQETDPPLLFLVVYLIINTIAVASTSGELRHVAQFMPGFIILAAFPDSGNMEVRHTLRTISKWWISAVVLVHLVWMLLKM